MEHGYYIWCPKIYFQLGQTIILITSEFCILLYMAVMGLLITCPPFGYLRKNNRQLLYDGINWWRQSLYNSRSYKTYNGLLNWIGTIKWWTYDGINWVGFIDIIFFRSACVKIIRNIEVSNFAVEILYERSFGHMITFWIFPQWFSNNKLALFCFMLRVNLCKNL